MILSVFTFPFFLSVVESFNLHCEELTCTDTVPLHRLWSDRHSLAQGPGEKG